MAQSFWPWDEKGLKIVHVSFHLGCHYNSVRSMKDPQISGEPAVNYNTCEGFEDLTYDEEEKTFIEESKNEVLNSEPMPSR